MANTYVDDTADPGQTDFAFNFPYLEDTHVTVEIDGVLQTLGELPDDYTIVVESNGDTKVRLNVAATGGEIVRVRRRSDPGTDLVDFQNGSVLTEADLDRAYQHNRYLNEESSEQTDDSLKLKAGVDGWEGQNKKLIDLADPVSTQDAATKNYVDTQDALKVSKSGDTMSGSLAMGGNKVTGLGAPTSGTDSATKSYVDIAVAGGVADGSVTPIKTDFDQLTIEADSVSEGQAGFAALELVGVNGSFIDLREDPESDYNARFINSLSETRLDSKDTIQIRSGIDLNTAFFINTDGKVKVGNNATPAYALDVAGDVNVTGNFKINGTNISSGGGVSKYSTSYVNSIGGVTVANNAVLPITHNLNTQAVQVYVYVNTVASSVGARSVSPEDFEVRHISNGSNAFDLRLADGYSVLLIQSGVRSSSFTYSGTYISVVVIG